MGTKRGKKKIDLTDVESCIQTARHRAEQLIRATQYLPPVDEDGGSECACAEEQYAKKEELQQEAQGLFRRLREFKADVEWLIESIKRDLAVVSAHENQINSDRARAHFSEAEEVLAVKYKGRLKLRDRIEKTIKILDRALLEADTKHYPGKLPEKMPGTEVSPPLVGQDQLATDERSGADKELQDLFDLDRKSRTENSDDSDTTF